MPARSFDQLRQHSLAVNSLVGLQERAFIAQHSDAWFALWDVRRDALVGPDFDAYWAGIGSHAIAPMVFGLVAAWWPLRDEPNVHLVHYADLQRAPEANMRAIA